MNREKHKAAWIGLQSKLNELDKFLNDNWADLRSDGENSIPRLEIGKNINEHLERMQMYTDSEIALIDGFDGWE